MVQPLACYECILTQVFPQIRLDAASLITKKEGGNENLRRDAAVKREAKDEDMELNIVAGLRKKARIEIETIDLTND